MTHCDLSRRQVERLIKRSPHEPRQPAPGPKHTKGFGERAGKVGEIHRTEPRGHPVKAPVFERKGAGVRDAELRVREPLLLRVLPGQRKHGLRGVRAHDVPARTHPSGLRQGRRSGSTREVQHSEPGSKIGSVEEQDRLIVP